MSEAVRNPYGLAFSEITTSSFLLCDLHDNVVEGKGEPEATAFYIHARLHALKPRARVAFHTHMPHSTALAMLEGAPLLWAGQTALRFHGRVAVDADYNGLALDEREGDRIAASVGDADIVFMKNHGIMILVGMVAEAWDDLYYLERAAQAQLLALSSGRPLKIVPEDIVRRVAAQEAAGREASARMHLESVKRTLALTDPTFLERCISTRRTAASRSPLWRFRPRCSGPPWRRSRRGRADRGVCSPSSG